MAIGDLKVSFFILVDKCVVIVNWTGWRHHNISVEYKLALRVIMELSRVLQQSCLHTVVVSDGNIILKMVVKKWNGRAWTGWIALAVRRGDGLEWIQQWSGAPKSLLFLGGGVSGRGLPWGCMQIIFNLKIMLWRSREMLRVDIQLGYWENLNWLKKKKGINIFVSLYIFQYSISQFHWRI